MKEQDNNFSRLSMGVENYLLSIFRLKEECNTVTISSLALHLKTLPIGEGIGTSLPSVGGMVRRLVREGFVTIDEQKKEVNFTKSGYTNAETIVKRHRLAERLVVDMFDVELYRAHTEAHLLEHAISSYLETKILSKLGNPSTSPYGYPIPGSNYVLNKKAVRISQLKSNTRIKIDRIPADDMSLLKYLVDNRLTPGNSVIVVDNNKSTGTISLSSSGIESVLSVDVAELVWGIPE